VTADETPKKKGRIARDLRTIQEISRDPRSIFPLARGWFVALWIKNGGGFFGLGYVIAFIVLEVATLGSAFDQSSASGFVLGQAVQYVIRVSVDSLVNTILALLWPIYLWRWLGPYYSPVVLVAAYFFFAFALRPFVEYWFPELKAARIEQARLKAEKRERRRQERAKRNER
jgi:hypothetical protein